MLHEAAPTIAKGVSGHNLHLQSFYNIKDYNTYTHICLQPFEL